MKSPTEYLARALGVLERRFVPWHTIWWNAYTPHIPRGDRYQDGYFDGYGENDDEDLSDDEMHIPALDIRKAIRNPVLRKIYKRLPYIDVVPVRRPEHTKERENVVVEITRAMYDQGKALYTRENMRSIEDQLDAHDIKLRGRMPVGRLLSHCEAPQTAWVKYTDFDGVVQHQGTWMTNSVEPTNGLSDDDGPVYARSQIEFRTIQELSMPDPDNANEVFANDQWEPSVAYNAMYVHYRYTNMLTMYGNPEDQMSADDMIARLGTYRETIKQSAEWKQLMAVADLSHPENGSLRSIDKIVFFYSTGLSDDCDFCQRATFLLALATCIRELVITARQDYHKNSKPRTANTHEPGTSTGSPGKDKGAGRSTTSNGAIPIYMPAFDISRRWNPSELSLLRHAGVIPIESNGRLFLKVDATSAVISYRNWNPVKQIVADIARPAMMVCKSPTKNPADDFGWREEDRDSGERVRVPKIRAKGFDNTIVARDPDSPRVREMLNGGRGGSYVKGGNVPELPGELADREVLSWFVRKKGVKVDVDYWT